MGKEYKIYIIENIINGKKYIGKTSKTLKNRFEKHIKNAKKKINRRLYDSMNYHGYDNFIIYEIDSLNTNDDANHKEKFYIKKYNTQNSEFGYNMTEGGDGGNTGKYYYGVSPFDWWVKKYGLKRADEMKKHAAKLAAEVNSSKMRGVSFEKRFGKERADEIKNKISSTNKKLGIKPPTQYWVDKQHPMLNKHHTKEARKKIALARKGKTYEEIFKNPETIPKLKEKKRQLLLGKNNPKYVEKLNDNKKKELLKMLINGDRLSDISKILDYSLYLLRKTLNEWDINNLQKLRNSDKKNVYLKKLENEYINSK